MIHDNEEIQLNNKKLKDAFADSKHIRNITFNSSGEGSVQIELEHALTDFTIDLAQDYSEIIAKANPSNSNRYFLNFLSQNIKVDELIEQKDDFLRELDQNKGRLENKYKEEYIEELWEHTDDAITLKTENIPDGVSMKWAKNMLGPQHVAITANYDQQTDKMHVSISKKDQEDTKQRYNLLESWAVGNRTAPPAGAFNALLQEQIINFSKTEAAYNNNKNTEESLEEERKKERERKINQQSEWTQTKTQQQESLPPRSDDDNNKHNIYSRLTEALNEGPDDSLLHKIANPTAMRIVGSAATKMAISSVATSTLIASGVAAPIAAAIVPVVFSGYAIWRAGKALNEALDNTVNEENTNDDFNFLQKMDAKIAILFSDRKAAVLQIGGIILGVGFGIFAGVNLVEEIEGLSEANDTSIAPTTNTMTNLNPNIIDDSNNTNTAATNDSNTIHDDQGTTQESPEVQQVEVTTQEATEYHTNEVGSEISNNPNTDTTQKSQAITPTESSSSDVTTDETDPTRQTNRLQNVKETPLGNAIDNQLTPEEINTTTAMEYTSINNVQPTAESHFTDMGFDGETENSSGMTEVDTRMTSQIQQDLLIAGYDIDWNDTLDEKTRDSISLFLEEEGILEINPADINSDNIAQLHALIHDESIAQVKHMQELLDMQNPTGNMGSYTQGLLVEKAVELGIEGVNDNNVVERSLKIMNTMIIQDQLNTDINMTNNSSTVTPAERIIAAGAGAPSTDRIIG